MKNTNRLNESDIIRMVTESLARLIMEDGELGAVGGQGDRMDDKFVFHIKGSPYATAERQLTYFESKLRELQNKAQTEGYQFSWESTESPDGGYIIKVHCDVPEIKKGNHELVAIVYPMRGENFSIVSPTAEYANDFEVHNELRKICMKAKCARCGASRERSMYYVFMNLETHELEKYGASCADIAFGINLVAKFKKIVEALTRLGTGGPGGGPIQAEGLPEEVNPEVTAACIFFAMNNGEEQPTKKNPNWINVLDATLRLNHAAYMDEMAVRNYREGNEVEPDYYQKELQKVSETLPEYVQNIAKGRLLENDFYSTVKEWAENMDIRTEFDEKVQQWGMYLANGRFHKKGIKELTKISWAKPWVVYKCLRDTKLGKPVPYGEFEGRQTINVKITDVSKRQSRQYDREPYWMVYAVTEDKKSLCWTSDNESTFKKGQELTINGEYARDWGECTALRDVRIGDIGQAEPEVINDGGYPTILRDYIVTTTNSNMFGINIEGEDGLQFFISNKFFAIPYYAKRVGARFKVKSAKVTSWVSKKDGSTQHGLNYIRLEPLQENKISLKVFENKNFQKVIVEAVRASIKKYLLN